MLWGELWSWSLLWLNPLISVYSKFCWLKLVFKFAFNLIIIFFSSYNRAYLSSCLHCHIHVASHQIVNMSCHSYKVFSSALCRQSFIFPCCVPSHWDLRLVWTAVHVFTIRCRSQYLVPVCRTTVDSLSPCSWFWVNGLIARKSTPKCNIMSMRHTSLFAIALARANISSVVVSPRPWTIFFEKRRCLLHVQQSCSLGIRWPVL